ncbi:MAG: cobalamin-binding protein [Sterolibacterium sp.]|jgi:iron complex transport system substrate-binding protein
MRLRHLFLLALLVPWLAHAEILVRDDAGQSVRLAAPARRIVSLAPHITENLYVAGAGALIVGVSEYSDYPEQARKLPRVGNYASLDLEAIVAQKPDLVIAWESGNPASHLAKLKALGLPLFISQPKNLDDIASSIERFGELAGTAAVAREAARAFRTRQATLRSRYADRPPVRTFYQIWNQPLATVNGEQLISKVMRLCGAENIFAGLSQLAPVVTLEAVLAANPEAIVASGMDDARPEWLDMWTRWKDLHANARGNLFFVPPDLINRHTPRVLDGAQLLCQHMETARGRRPVMPR